MTRGFRGFGARVALVLAGFGVVLLGALLGAQPAQAQDGPAWIQIEAHPDLATAEERARAYGPVVTDLAGFRLGSRWYALALGPYAPAEAAGKMAALKAAGQIPRDAYITDGSDHGAQFWPVGAAASTAPATDAAAPETAAPEPSPPAPADETLTQAQASEAALSRDEKIELQTALQWYGFYEGKLDGSFGRGTRASMAAWQGAMGYEATGVLTTLQRSTLSANHRADIAAFGFTPVTEAEAGVEFSLPAALLEFDHYEPPFVHYTAKDGSALRLLIISEPGDATTLAGLYDMLQTLEVVPAAGERALSEAEFTINAASESVASFATARASKGAIKGYLLVWEPAQTETAQRILATMAASFRSTGDRVLDPGLVPLDDTVKAGVLAGMAVKEPKSTLSGIYLDAGGTVLTSAGGVAACGKITLDGSLEAEVAAADTALGAAVLRPTAPAAPLGFATPAAQSLPAGARVLLAGYSLPKGLPAPVLTQGQIETTTGPSGEAGLMTLAANVTPHDLGGPVLDDRGALVGMIFGTELGGKTLPEGIALARDMASLAPLLAQAGVVAAAGEAAAAPLTPDAWNAAAMGMTVQVACWP